MNPDDTVTRIQPAQPTGDQYAPAPAADYGTPTTIELASVPTDQPAPAVQSAPTIQRGARTRFLPRAETAEDQVTVTRRALLGERKKPGQQKLSRHHKVAGNLPSWDPLPPNEQLVRRPR